MYVSVSNATVGDVYSQNIELNKFIKWLNETFVINFMAKLTTFMIKLSTGNMLYFVSTYLPTLNSWTLY